ncbi:MAG: long-chain fatty acid--CoA ligase [Myxococcales bacterium]
MSPSGSGSIASLVELLEINREQFGPRTLFVTKSGGHWTETSYADFARQVDWLRGGLAALGVGQGDHVGIIAANCLAWAVAAYATYGLGAAFVPMYESQHEKDWAFIVRDSGMKVLFVANPSLHARVESFARSISTLRHLVLISGDEQFTTANTYESLSRNGASFPVGSVHPEAIDSAALLYTSGTTGEPKGVILSHGNILSNALTLRDLILATERPENHRSLSFLPWAHAFGHTTELHMLIAAGASIAIAEGVDKIVENIKEIRPTVLFAVPRVFNRIHAGVQKLMATKSAPVRWLFRSGLRAARRRARGAALKVHERIVFFLADKLVFSKVRARFGGRLRFAISGAASLAQEVAEFIDGIGIAVYEGYGLTEASPIVTANIPGHRKMGSVGRPLPGVRVVIEPSASGDSRQGEVVIYGPNVMKRYHNCAEETRAVITADGGLRSGDMGYLDEEQYLFISGRLKEQYKQANGKYVVPSPLEERLKLSPLIANVMIYGDNRPYNVALVVPSTDGVLEWAAANGANGFGDRTVSELTQNPALKEKITQEIAALSTRFKHYERVKAIALIAEDFTQRNEMLTPSMKLRRHIIVQRWRDQLDSLYRADNGGTDDAWSPGLTCDG